MLHDQEIFLSKNFNISECSNLNLNKARESAENEEQGAFLASFYLSRLNMVVVLCSFSLFPFSSPFSSFLKTDFALF